MAKLITNRAKISGIVVVSADNLRCIDDDVELYGGDKKKIERVKRIVGLDKRFVVDENTTAAALATIKKFKNKKVARHLIRIGESVKKGWARAAKKHNLKIEVSGIDPMGHFGFEYDNPLVLKTLFTQFMLAEGFLATNAFYASYAHKPEHVTRYLAAVDRSFAEIADALKKGNPEKRLKGPVSHAGFKRLT